VSPNRVGARSAAELRGEFDAAFARAPAVAEPPSLDLLRVRVSSRSLCLKISEILGVHRDFSLALVPSPSAALRGLVGLRGKIVPVYDLASVLGLGATDAPRWLVELRTPDPCALGFEALEGQLRVPLSQVAPAEVRAPTQLVSGGVTTAAGTLPLLDSSAIYTELTRHRTERVLADIEEKK
jgi:chemotaxis signal transduction protein